MRSSTRTSSIDRLYSKVAVKILTESLHLQKGESITVETRNNGKAFAKRIVMEARKLGAIPLVVFEDEAAHVQGAKTMDKEYRGKLGKHEYGLLSGTDAYVFIPGPPLSAFYSDLSNEERIASVGYNSSWYDAAEKAKLRGVRLSFGYVGREVSKVLGKSRERIVEQQLRTLLETDLHSMIESGKELAQYMRDDSNCTIKSDEGSELNFRLRGETEIEDGVVDERDVSEGSNMTYLPPGLLSKMIDSSTVSGTVKGISGTTPYGLIKGGSLEFDSGKLVKWESKSTMKALDKVIQSISEDSRRLLLFSIGLNSAAKFGYNIDRFMIGSASLSMTSRFAAILPKASISVDGEGILRSGKLILSR